MKRAVLFAWVIGCCWAMAGCDAGDDDDIDDGDGNGVSSCADVCEEIGDDEDGIDCLGEELIGLGHEGIMESDECDVVDADSCKACVQDIDIPDGDCVQAFDDCS